MFEILKNSRPHLFSNFVQNSKNSVSLKLFWNFRFSSHQLVRVFKNIYATVHIKKIAWYRGIYRNIKVLNTFAMCFFSVVAVRSGG